MKRGQVSVEFISIFGFVFLMTIPLIIIFFDQSGSVQDAIATNHLRNVAIKMVDKAETIYYLGEPSKTTLKTSFPDHLESVTILSKAVVFEYRTSRNNLQQIVATSKVNLTGSLSAQPGIHYIEIESSGGEVLISG